MIEDKFIREIAEKGELFQLLVGLNGYQVANRYLNTPTDPDLVFKRLMPELQENEPLLKSFIEEIERTCESPEYAYMGVYYLFDIRDNARLFEKHIAPIPFIFKMMEKIELQKESLLQNHTRAAANDPQGWWGIASRTMEVLKESL